MKRFIVILLIAQFQVIGVWGQQSLTIQGRIECESDADQIIRAKNVVVQLKDKTNHIKDVTRTTDSGYFELKAQNKEGLVGSTITLKMEGQCKFCKIDTSFAINTDQLTVESGSMVYRFGRWQVNLACTDLDMGVDRAGDLVGELTESIDNDGNSKFSTGNDLWAVIKAAASRTYETTLKLVGILPSGTGTCRPQPCIPYPVVTTNYSDLNSTLARSDVLLSIYNPDPGYYSSPTHKDHNYLNGNLSAYALDTTSHFFSGFYNLFNIFQIGSGFKLSPNLKMAMSFNHVVQQDQITRTITTLYSADSSTINSGIATNVKSYESLINLGAAFKINDIMSVSAALRYNIQEFSSTNYEGLDEIDTISISNRSWDTNLSFTLKPSNRLQFGFVINNLLGSDLVSQLNPNGIEKFQFLNGRFLSAGFSYQHPKWSVGYDVFYYNDSFDSVVGLTVSPFDNLRLQTAYNTFDKELSYHLNFHSFYLAFAKVSDTIVYNQVGNDQSVNLYNFFGGLNIRF